MKNKKKNKGFTLIELVIVIAIIAILISIAAMKYSSTNLAAEAAAHNANVKVLKSAGILYLIDHPDSDKKISAEALKPYLEGGKIPKPAKHLNGAKDFTITSTEDGDVIVSPGPLKVQDKKLVEENEK
ncbi:prepilin-type N-terminal cleavage/methylation domain-containing protein [Peptoniphilus sp.]|uniref:prepilin-type N-terminal cleavage/methylation domain-containing protein n=1 Tax=Peptoniphilus sp. TaxID=1971214 RepID=UPI003993F951